MLSLNRSLWAVALILPLSVVACSHEDEDQTTPHANGAIVPERLVCSGPTGLYPTDASLAIPVRACRGSLNDAELDDAVAIVGRFEDGLAPVLSGAGLFTNWVLRPVLDSFVVLLTATIARAEAKNEATFDPANSTYTIVVHDDFGGRGLTWTPMKPTDDYRLTFQLRWPFDTATAKKGDVLTADVTSLDSYLQGANVSVDPFTQRATIRYRTPGPLVEMLGLGASPENPLVLSPELADRVRKNLRAVPADGKMSAQYGLQEGCGASRLEFSLTTTLGEVADRGGTPLTLTRGTTMRSYAPSQTLVVRDWNFVAGAGSATGIAHVDVTGDVEATFEWKDTLTPSRTLACKALRGN